MQNKEFRKKPCRFSIQSKGDQDHFKRIQKHKPEGLKKKKNDKLDYATIKNFFSLKVL